MEKEQQPVAVKKTQPLALSAPPTRAALPGFAALPREHRVYDDAQRLDEYAASLYGTSLDEFYRDSLGPIYRPNRPTGAGPPGTRDTPKRPNLAGFYAAELRGLEADMEKSPHGKSTHLIGKPVTPSGFLDGPAAPRPGRVESASPGSGSTLFWRSLWRSLALRNVVSRSRTMVEVLAISPRPPIMVYTTDRGEAPNDAPNAAHWSPTGLPSAHQARRQR